MRLGQIVLMVMVLGIAGSGLAPAEAFAQGRSPAEKANAVSKGVESPAERAAPALQGDKGAQDEARRRKKKQPKCAGKVATIRDHRGAIVGTAKNDVIVGDAKVNTIDGGGGNDLICGLGGADNIDGGTGNDTVNAGGGGVQGAAQVVQGGEGNDTLNGGNGADNMLGEEGDDTVNGNGGDDILFGDRFQASGFLDGDDTLRGGDGTDVLVGGGGTNRCEQDPGQGLSAC